MYRDTPLRPHIPLIFDNQSHATWPSRVDAPAIKKAKLRKHGPLATNRLRLFAAVDTLLLRRELLRLLPHLSVLHVVAEYEKWTREVQQSGAGVWARNIRLLLSSWRSLDT